MAKRRRRSRPKYRLRKNPATGAWCIVVGKTSRKLSCHRTKRNARKAYARICGPVRRRRKRR